MRFNRVTSPSLIAVSGNLIRILHLPLSGLHKHQLTVSLAHVKCRLQWYNGRNRSIYGKSQRAVVHDAAIIVRGGEHRDVSFELLKIEPGLLLNVVPIHFDEIVTFAMRGEKPNKKT